MGFAGSRTSADRSVGHFGGLRVLPRVDGNRAPHECIRDQLFQERRFLHGPNSFPYPCALLAQRRRWVPSVQAVQLFWGGAHSAVASDLQLWLDRQGYGLTYGESGAPQRSTNPSPSPQGLILCSIGSYEVITHPIRGRGSGEYE